MQNDYNHDSYKKGEQFENYVERVIFPEAHYELIYKTSDTRQNFQRYPRKSKEPDFQFKSHITGKKFYVEAKWRAKPYNGKFDVLSKNQFDSFPKLDSENSPVFVAFGYGGQPYEPDCISLIPLSEIDSIKMLPEKVHQFNIEKTFFPPSNFSNKEEVPETKPEEKENIQPKPKINTIKKNKKLYALAAVGLVAILISIYSYSFSSSEVSLSPENRFQHIIENYYQDMNSNNIEKLPDYLSSNIESWYGSKNMTTNQIVKDAKKHRGTYPYSSTDIDWNTFKVVEKDDGNYLISYNMIYKAKKNIDDNYKVYNLHILSTWDKNFKMLSIREIRN